MRKLVLVALVLLVVVVGLPLIAGMGDMAPCPSCAATDGPLVLAMCLAIVAIVSLSIRFSSVRIRSRSGHFNLFLLARRVERPPQLV